MTDPADSWPQLDVVAVGAHPDDVEIACGGTLARLVEQGHRVGIIDLTNGEPTPLCPDPQVRLAEAAAAAAPSPRWRCRRGASRGLSSVERDRLGLAASGAPG
jgi:hypothetical protein